MLDRAATYRTSQILTASPVERVILLYRGAIRFATTQASETEQGHRETAHHASMRAQEIVGALRETLDLSAGPVALQLDGLYAFCLRRLIDGNLRQDGALAREAIQVLQGLLDAWIQIAGATASPPVSTISASSTLPARWRPRGRLRSPAMTARIDAGLSAQPRLLAYRGDALRARAVLGRNAAPAIARRLDAVLPVGPDFASALRTQVELARRSGDHA